jgi:hypothetical protein
MVQFHQILKRLHDHQVEFVIIGGVAGTLHGSPVATFGVDIMAPLNDAPHPHYCPANFCITPNSACVPARPSPVAWAVVKS